MKEQQWEGKHKKNEANRKKCKANLISNEESGEERKRKRIKEKKEKEKDRKLNEKSEKKGRESIYETSRSSEKNDYEENSQKLTEFLYSRHKNKKEEENLRKGNSFLCICT